MSSNPSPTLGSLLVENYRLFDRVEVPRLGRVNLITGRNNVGKTSILEALRLYAERANPSAVLEILGERDELPAAGEPDIRALLDGLRGLGRWSNVALEDALLFRVGPADDPHHVMSVFLSRKVGSRWIIPREGSRSETPELFITLGEAPWLRGLDAFLAQAKGSKFLDAPASFEPVPCRFVPPGGLCRSSATLLWDQIALTEAEDQVVRALQIVAPGLTRISLVSSQSRPEAPGGNGARTFKVRTRESREPIPLRAMGDGMNRILGITLALVSARGGLLLIDEFENGIHHTAQAEVWSHVFRLAGDLDVQVFATTHSYDCVLAFQEAAQSQPADGALLRIENKQGRFRVTTFDEESLAVVAAGNVEVR